MTPLDIAKTQVGVQEEPKNSNWGPQIKNYLRAAAILSPAPWCVAFVVWCCRQAGIKQDRIPTTASSTFLLNWAKEKGKIVRDPQPGDIFLLLRKGGSTAFHCGFVQQAGRLAFRTVEGNSNDQGSAEGYEVCMRNRSRLGRVAFLRI